MKITTLVSCCLIHLVISSIYAEIVLHLPIVEVTGWPYWIVKAGFCLKILFIALASIITRYSEKRSSKTIMFGGFGYVLSVASFWLAILHSERFVLGADLSYIPYLTACCLIGFNVGVLYSITIARMIQTQKNLDILAGLVMVCFVIGSLLAVEAFNYLIGFGLRSTINYYIASCVILMIAILMYEDNNVITKSQ